MFGPFRTFFLFASQSGSWLVGEEYGTQQKRSIRTRAAGSFPLAHDARWIRTSTTARQQAWRRRRRALRAGIEKSLEGTLPRSSATTVVTSSPQPDYLRVPPPCVLPRAPPPHVPLGARDAPLNPAPAHRPPPCLLRPPPFRSQPLAAGACRHDDLESQRASRGAGCAPHRRGPLAPHHVTFVANGPDTHKFEYAHDLLLLAFLVSAVYVHFPRT